MEKLFLYTRGRLLMETAEYLDSLLLNYSGSFNIYQPYTINNKVYPAYGLFYSLIEKYILIREVNMWSTKSYDHVLFMETEECTEAVFMEARKIIEEYMEPVLVRKNEKLPEKNHMYSYLNVVIISQKALSREMEKIIKKYHFEKGYSFNFRGYSKGSIVAVSLEDKRFISNYHSRNKKKMFLKVFENIAEGKPTFSQVMEERGLEPFKQEIQ